MTFFKSFNRQKESRSQYQQDFLRFLDKALVKYKAQRNVSRTNKHNRDEIFAGLKNKLAIDYFKNIDLLDNYEYKVAKKIFYLRSMQKIRNKTLFQKCAQNEYPDELPEQFGCFFPITERGDLRDIPEYYSRLRQYYTFDKLPETYFNVLSKNLQLLFTSQELKEQLRNLFSCKPTNEEVFRTYINLLRKHYSFTRVPKCSS
ncbi:hypothetical protein F8M41_012040 [Gigaspora margarita]|uniref:Uncharacterized protein n=1 Tax=Gigaspora margarita TaxID=4874 RepID=A0A8H3X1K9_GIGMA|nr:hypothetical protein F8M41_012040 [Gigaspora margarita]